MTRITTKGGAAIYATLERNVLCSVDYADMTNLVPCSHEEADTRLLLHVADADKAGYRKVCVSTVDTDVVVLAVAHYNNKKPDELWVAFGTGSHFRYIPVHEVTASLVSIMCSTLHVFHAFTGCDIVLAFGGGGGGERQENSLGHMAVVPRSYGRIWRPLAPARWDR